MSSEDIKDKEFVILGAGPAGMGAAWELYKQGAKHITVIDRNDRVGGLARTVRFKGYYFDMGPHRFLTKYGEVEALWKEILGEDLLERPRVTRIYYRGRFFTYPLRITNALWNLGVWQSFLAGLSFFKAQILWRGKEPQNFAQWTTKTFGNRISRAFFRDYTRKVWGIGADEVGTDWAGQRIKPLKLRDLLGPIRDAILSRKEPEDIGAHFFYPRYGAGMFYETMQKKLEDAGVTFLLGGDISAVRRDGTRILSVVAERDSGGQEIIAGDIFLSSIPSNLFIASLEPAVSKDVLALTEAMRFRAHIAVNMIVDRKDLFPDSWLYIQSTEFRIARIGNYGAFSPDMLKDPDTSAIGIELYCFAGDGFWQKSDTDIIATVLTEMCALGFMTKEEFVDAFVVRHADAYPTHYLGFREGFARLRAYFETFGNLRMIGRAGMYKYKDQDHALYTGILTVRNLFGADHDVWELGEEKEFFEDKDASQ
ncbi:hypothetical protein A2765_00720 [Candidatus Kaiserbacteria bacterium RIFCSPHIGHO2_01_FULL_56_24]|uniref:Amine oxidase domain-containing protein n=1 Tax=Candidatus Kaiserbacteria bacterium RIFCSPHIGHO2_01_FULL_56_24 TaxID=1798487 RepID=A0A1F6DBR3_9BACT|nr:MAG: hypothetical protein A2765_00720 [Candidatus Kaiserbacteria bacterium RIFCSPHIGHO2_01_FULL_56_24]